MGFLFLHFNKIKYAYTQYQRNVLSNQIAEPDLNNKSLFEKIIITIYRISEKKESFGTIVLALRDLDNKHKPFPFIFWDVDDSNPDFCQQSLSKIYANSVEYNCAEQYMMAQKSKTMQDIETMNLILTESNPQKQHELGRIIKDYDENKWNLYKYNIVKEGNWHKFTQDINLLRILLSTGKSWMVEASDEDKIWGIGVLADKVINNPDPNANWPGENLLGKIYMDIREKLVSEIITKDTTIDDLQKFVDKCKENEKTRTIHFVH